LLHHFWTTEHLNLSFTKYDELLEILQQTPRMWNNKSHVIQTLKYLTYKLNINLNIVEFKRSQNACTVHHNQRCFYPTYKFHNPFVKLLMPISKHKPIVITEFKKNFYIMTKIPNHILINKLSINSILIGDYTITNTDVLNILQNTTVKLPFSIALYTTFSYVKENSINIIKNNCLAYHHVTDKIVHLFITPDIIFPTVNICLLNTIFEKPLKINHLHSLPHTTEGNLIYNSSRTPNNDTLNQNYCICEHPITKRFMSPTYSSFKHLGN
jgi:hypothetical protein